MWFCVCSALLISACSDTENEVDRAFLKDLNVVDDNNLNDVMLNVADPDEAVSYFQRTLRDNPDRGDVRRGLAKSLARARRNTEAIAAWKSVVSHEHAPATAQVGDKCGDLSLTHAGVKATTGTATVAQCW